MADAGVADGCEAAARELGAEVVLFGATYPLALLGPRPCGARHCPYLAAAHGFEYWLSIAPGDARADAARDRRGRRACR